MTDPLELTKLGDNWDDEGARPPTLATARFAQKVIDRAKEIGIARYAVSPVADGAINVVLCQPGSKRYVTIDASESGELYACTSDGEGELNVWEVARTDAEIDKALIAIRDFLQAEQPVIA